MANEVISTYDGKQLAAYSDVAGHKLELTIDDDNKVSAIGGRELAGSGGLATVSVDESLQGDGSAEHPLGVASPVDVVAGPGVVIDNPDGNTLRISMAKDDETVLFECADGVNGATSGTLSESRKNFDHLVLEVGVGGQSGSDGTTLVSVSNRFNTAWIQYGMGAGGANAYYCAAKITWTSDTEFNINNGSSILHSETSTTVSGNTAYNSTVKQCVYKVVGIRRLNGIGPSDTVEGLPVREYTAGPGVVIDPVNKTISAPAAEEVVLWEGAYVAGSGTITLSEAMKNFKYVEVLAGTDADGYRVYTLYPSTTPPSAMALGKERNLVSGSSTFGYYFAYGLTWDTATTTMTLSAGPGYRWNGTAIDKHYANNNEMIIKSVTGVHRITGGN